MRKERTGRGAVVDVSLLGAGLWMVSPGIVASQLYGIDNIPRYRHADLPNPLVAAYATRDNRLVYMSGIQTEGHFEEFCTLIGRKDLLDDPRFATGTARQAHTRECIGVLDEIFAARDLAEWATILAGLSTPWSIVQSAAEAAVDPQTTANHYIAEVQGARRLASRWWPARPSSTARPPPSPAPRITASTPRRSCSSWRDWDDIVRLKEIGAVL